MDAAAIESFKTFSCVVTALQQHQPLPHNLDIDLAQDSGGCVKPGQPIK